MVIGIMGLDFDSNNLGCGALSYGFLEVINRIARESDTVLTVISFDQCDSGRVQSYLNDRMISLKCAPEISIKYVKGLITQIRYYKECDVIFDFSAGDSFSDIYGKGRFYKRTIRKELILISGTPLVLGSQTYGPYKSLGAKWFASHVIKKSFKVFSRDHLSSDAVKRIAGISPLETVDAAFALPYTKNRKPEKDKLVIGFNPSGLLWAGGYSGSNQFGLNFDYKVFCVKCIEELIKMPNAEIKLVSHVRSKDLTSRDNDLVACNELRARFPSIEEPAFFDTPMEAKSFISSLDVLIGSRMHATIAAFTAQVITIPVAYSRKFKGLFDGLDYPFVIDAGSESVDGAIRKIISIINDKDNMKQLMNDRQYAVREGEACLYSSIKDVLNECSMEK